MTGIEDEARREAEKRWPKMRDDEPLTYPRKEDVREFRHGGFVQGAVWAASRHEQHRQDCIDAMDEARQCCPHCPDGHARPESRPWAVFVASERDGDGQPTHLYVAPTAGQHVAESDAEWARRLLNGAASRQRESAPSVEDVGDVLRQHAASPAGSPHCICGWRPRMYLNDTESDRQQHRDHQAERVAALYAPAPDTKEDAS